jgi:hypothetical protein
VLLGWRATTIAVDIRLEPEQDELELVDAEGLVERFAQIEPELYRFPAVDAARFRPAVERVGN